MSGARSRNKGSSSEREVAQALFLELGIGFRRDLEQVRSAGCGDLVADDPDFPFLCEIKRRASGVTYCPAWWQQVCTAACGAGLYPSLFYRFDRQAWRVVIPLAAVGEADGGDRGLSGVCQLTLPEFCVVAREILARRRA